MTKTAGTTHVNDRSAAVRSRIAPMIVAMERKLISELIEEYKSCTCLWRIKDPDYKNKEMKNASYDSLLQLIKKYINNL